MDEELLETLRLIISRYEGRSQGSVFIPMKDFSWYHERNGQLSRLCEEGMILRPRYSDNGAEITLTQKGRHFFDEPKNMIKTLTKEKMIEILTALSTDINTPWKDLGYSDIKDYWADVERLWQQKLILLQTKPIHGGWDHRPTFLRMEGAFVTDKGYRFLQDCKSNDVDLTEELRNACIKVSDNPVTCGNLDEDGLNRQIRDFLRSGIERFGYLITDQTQQGFGENDAAPGELDIRISKNGIPIAIYEGLVHRDKAWMESHIEKAKGKYNQSGCRAIYVVEFSRNKRFNSYWGNTLDNLDEYDGIKGSETDTGVNGVKLFKGTIDWQGQVADFYYFGLPFTVKKHQIRVFHNKPQTKPDQWSGRFFLFFSNVTRDVTENICIFKE